VFGLTQCTWDLPPDACKGCLDALAANVSATFPATARGERKSYSCRVRYNVNTSFMVVPFNLSTGSAGTPTSSLAGPGSVNSAKNNGQYDVTFLLGDDFWNKFKYLYYLKILYKYTIV
jgi:hypothetical protein